MRKLIVIALAAFLATAAVAIAASTDQGRRLTGPFCINKTTGIVRSVALLHTGTCKASEVRRVGVAVPLTPGPKGDKGDTGATGATGPAGANGSNGTDGKDAPTVQYAQGAVLVKRGTNGAFARWATYSTSLGGPYGNTASGTFRFTCSTANAPCSVELAADATVAGVKVYPRILIYKSSLDTGQVFGQCEYGDGADNNNSTEPVGSLTVGIGGSLDCGSAQAYPTNGVATQIDVPAGYYDVFSTFVFTQ